MANANPTASHNLADAIEASDKITINLSFAQAQLSAILALLDGAEDKESDDARVVAHAALNFLDLVEEGASELYEIAKEAKEAAQ